jgi:hypothetical protein
MIPSSIAIVPEMGTISAEALYRVHPTNSAFSENYSAFKISVKEIPDIHRCVLNLC